MYHLGGMSVLFMHICFIYDDVCITLIVGKGRHNYILIKLLNLEYWMANKQEMVEDINIKAFG